MINFKRLYAEVSRQSEPRPLEDDLEWVYLSIRNAHVSRQRKTSIMATSATRAKEIAEKLEAAGFTAKPTLLIGHWVDVTW